MDASRWQRLESVFEAALALPAAERRRFVDDTCGDDAELHAELLALLASHGESGILDRPPPVPAGLAALPGQAGAATPSTAPTVAEGPGSGGAGAVAALAPGTRLGPYEVVGLLGAGGMGEVYRARDPRLGRDVAVKRVRGAEPGVESLRRFDQEARAAGALNHPNLLAVYDVGVEGGIPYVVTELLEGETLRQRLRAGALPAREVVRLARLILAGLVAAHDKGIVHRDLKPENLFLTLDARLKILDFGLAKQIGAAGLDQSLTGAGRIIGTLGYTAPEQLRGQPAEARSDLFALGAVMYEMLCGRRAFAGASALETVGAVLGDEPPPLGVRDVPAALERLVRRCLAKRPEERPASARELLEALEAAAAFPDGAASPRPSTAQRGAPAAETRSLAVLPFLNLTGDPTQEYFCEGIAEELLHALGTLSGVRIAARSSSFHFRGQEDAIRRLGRELRVDTVVEGSVRKAGERLRIAVQLVSVADSSHLWSARYDLAGGDVFAVQEEIASRIAGALRLRLSSGSSAVHRPASLEAYHLYLKGRYHWNKRHAGGLREGVRAFEGALEHDPLYARAWAGLADSYALLGYSLYDLMPASEGMPRAKVAALKALEIDPSLPEPYAALGWVRFHHEWDWGGAERDFRRSLELGPDIATTRHWYSFFLSVLGRDEEAREQALRAWELDPLSLVVNANLAQPAYHARRFAEVAAAARKLTEMEPGFAIGHFWLGVALAAEQRHGEAIPALEAFGRLLAPTTRAAALIGHCLARRGQTDDARAVLAQLDAVAAERPVPAYHRALVLLGLGDTAAALGELERAADEGSDALAYLAVEPLLDPLREQPRFVDLLRRVGLDGVAGRLYGGGSQAGPQPRRRTVAVLPFRPAGGGADGNLGLGLADATITELAQIESLVVRPTSAILAYAERTVEAARAGRELGVDLVLTGTVERREERLRIGLELTTAGNGGVLWSGEVDGAASDLFAIQDEVSRRVAGALTPAVAAAEAVARRPAPAGGAYGLFLQGRAHLLRETLHELVAAIDLFEGARAADPSYAPAWAWLGDAYARMAFNFQPNGDWYRRAEEMCDQALRLEPDLPEGLYTRGRLRWTPQRGWDHEGAIRDFCTALRARPGFDEAHLRLGVVLYHVGLIEPAVRHIEHALAIAPDHSLASYQVGFCRYHQGRYEEALEITERVTRNAPSAWILYQMASVQLRLGRLADAVASADRITREFPDSAGRVARDFPGDVLAHPIRALVAARTGNAAEAREQARLTTSQHHAFGHFHHAQYDLACVHAMLGEPAPAVRELAAAAANGYPCATLFEGDPLLAPLHGDAAFRSLLEELRRGRARYESLYAELRPSRGAG
jgi:serine/threonine-protein kinase